MYNGTPEISSGFEKNEILIKRNNQILRLTKDDIIFCENNSGQLHIHTLTEIYQVHCSLTDIEKELGYPFFRSHRSFIVNLRKIKPVNNTGDRVYEIHFHDYDRIAWLSRGKHNEFVKMLDAEYFKNTK